MLLGISVSLVIVIAVVVGLFAWLKQNKNGPTVRKVGVVEPSAPNVNIGGT